MPDRSKNRARQIVDPGLMGWGLGVWLTAPPQIIVMKGVRAELSLKGIRGTMEKKKTHTGL
jgi:hypothetical protein